MFPGIWLPSGRAGLRFSLSAMLIPKQNSFTALSALSVQDFTRRIRPRHKSRDGSVRCLGLRDGQSEVRIPTDAKDFLFFKPPISTLGPAQPPIQWVLEFFDGVKAAGAWSCSPPSIVEVRNERSYTSIPLTCRHGVYMDSLLFFILSKTNSAFRGRALRSGNSWGLDGVGMITNVACF
jgi:hypothetical protein